MNETAETLLHEARQARERAYAPYSHFLVGAALLTRDGRRFDGCNVENAAYPVGNCAEASAIAAMVAAGENRIASILVIGNGDALVTPCGACRQRIREFGRPETPILIAGPEGVRASFTLGELLPHSFGPDHLLPA